MTIARRRFGTTLAVLGVLLAGACGGTAGDTGTDAKPVSSDENRSACGQQDRTITHDLGTTKISGDPQRVVTTEFSFADAVSLAGIKPVGIADDNDASHVIAPLRARVGDYTSVGLRESPSISRITALKPDLIIIDSIRNKAIYGQLSKIAPTIALPSQETTYEANLTSMTVIGQALDRCDQIEQALAQHRKVMAGYKSQLAQLGDLPTFVFAVAADKTFYAHNAAAYVPSVLQSLGLRSALPADPSSSQNEIGLEALAAAKPQALFVALYTPQTVIDSWQHNQLYTSIPAVADGRDFDVDPDIWARSRGTTAAEIIARQTLQYLKSAD